MAENAGAIYYTVDARTKEAIDGIDAVGRSTDKMGKNFAEADKAVSSTGTKLTATASAARQMAAESSAAARGVDTLRFALGGLLGLQGARAVTELADSYTNLQNRLRLVTTSNTQLAQATDSVFNIAQRTSQEVGTIAEVYQRFAQNAKELGISQATVASVTETVAKAVAISGASAASAQAALTQFGQALASGTLRGEELNSVMEQTPGLAAAIAKGLGIGIGQLRALAAEGKITGQKLIEALGKAGDDVDKQFNTRIKTVGQSVVELQNNLQRFVGELTTTSGASATLAKTITAISDNLGTLSALLAAAGAGALANYIAKLTLKTVATLKDAAATRATAVAEMNLAKAQVTTAQAALAQTTGLAANAQTKALVAARTDALAAAELRYAAASRASGTAMGLAAGLLGGPVGIITLVATAAAGMYLMRDGTDAADKAYKDLNGTMQDTVAKLELMTESQRRIASGAAVRDLANATNELGAALDKVAKGPMVGGGQTQWAWAQFAGKEIKNLNQQIMAGDITAQQYDAAVNKLADDFRAAGNGSDKWRDAITELTDSASKAATTFNTASANSSRLAGGLQQVEAAARNATPALRELNAEAGRNGDPGKFLKSLQETVGKLQDGGSKVKEATRMLAEWKKEGKEAGSTVAAEIMAAATAADKLTAAQKAAKTGATAHNKELNDSKQKAKENAKALDELAKELERLKLAEDAFARQSGADKLNKFATPEQIARAKELNEQIYLLGEQKKADESLSSLAQQLALANLRGRELAMTQAELALGQYATREQVEWARKYAGELYDINKQKELSEKIGEDTNRYVRGDVQPISGGPFDTQDARFDAEARKEQDRYEAQLVRLREAMEAQKYTQEEYYAQFQSLASENAKRIEQIEQARYSTQLQSASDVFGNIASITKEFAGEQSGIYKAMFAASKAFAIADSIVKIQTGLANAAAMPFPGNLAAMASVAAATAGIISTISGTNMGSGRQYGGNVMPGSMHRINENGRPEVYNAANGQQFLLPNSRGKVVSNYDASGDGGAGVQVNTAAPINIETNIYMSSDGGAQTSVAAQGSQDNVGAQLAQLVSMQIKDTLQRERAPGGILWNMQNGR